MASYNFEFTSTGGPAIESQIKSILNGAKATSSEILALSRALGVSAQQAASFAAKIGLGVGETAAVAQKLKQLQAAGLSTAQAYKVLQRENGITIKQFRELNTGLKDVTKEQQEYTVRTRQSSEAAAAQVLALQQVNAAAQQAAAQLQGLASKAVGEFIQYDDALTSVAAKAGVAKTELGFLEEAVLDVALSTSQSPVSAVKAADSLIALGASAEEAADKVKTVAQLTDALRTVGADAETAAKVIQLGTSIFEEFGVSAQDVGDKIALISDTSAVASSTGLQEFLQLFSKAGGIAAQLDVGLDELLANFATLRDAGQAPEVAATSLKSLLSTVLSSREKLEDLGLTVFDVNDKFVGLTSIFQQLSERGTSATELVELFGKIGVASATALSEGYADTVAATDRLAAAQGNLQEKSDAINSSIKGQAELLQGSLQTALVELGEVLGQFSGPAIGSLLSLVNAFLDAPPVFKKFTAATIGVAAATASAIAAITGYTLALKAAQASGVLQTLSMIKQAAATAAETAATGINTAVRVANTKVKLSDVAASAVQTVATKAQTVATKAQTAAILIQTGAIQANLQARAAAAVAAAAPYLALAGAIAGVTAAGALVINTYQKVDKEASSIRSSTDAAAEAQLEYMKSLAAAGQAGAAGGARCRSTHSSDR
jgi:TP901 family phage tail tape measure protein